MYQSKYEYHSYIRVKVTDLLKTPVEHHQILELSDIWLLISNVYDLLHKKDSNQLLIIPRKP